MNAFDIGFSTCPNDTFIFHAMIHGSIDTGDFKFLPHLHDVEELNKKAFSGTFHMTKLSFYAYLKLREHYEILDSGSALGFGCGPLLIGKKSDISFANARIAIPGELTTAYLLLKLWNPDIKNVVATRFDNILEGVESGKYDAGLIIHEGRFIYPDYNCIKIVDLGEWWEKETSLPIPLGCIAIKKDEKIYQHKSSIEKILRHSVEFALMNRDVSRAFVKEHAQELDDTVIDSHIDLYVNDYTVSLGDEGIKAIHKLEEMAQWKKIL